MAPLPADSTARYKIFYHDSAHAHTTTLRASGSHSPSNVGAQFDTLMTALDPLLFLVTIDRMEFAPNGSNIFNTVVSGIEGNTYGSGSTPLSAAPFFFGFVGRTSGARKSRFMVFGANDVGTNYRFSAGENAATDGAVLVPQASSNLFFGIDGIKPTWYGYVNVGSDAYWQRKGR